MTKDACSKCEEHNSIQSLHLEAPSKTPKKQHGQYEKQSKILKPEGTVLFTALIKGRERGKQSCRF